MHTEAKKISYTCIKTLVRPHLEYANKVSTSHLKKNIVSIENVLRSATKLIPFQKG